jgi:hypothetical protein
MATYCVSIHDLLLLLRQKEDTTKCWRLDSDSDQPGHDSHEETDAADSCSLDAGSDQLDLDDNDETKLEVSDQQKVVGRPESCPGIRTKLRRNQRIDALADREHRSREEAS